MESQQTTRQEQADLIEQLLPDNEEWKSHIYYVKGKDVWHFVRKLLSKANVVRVSIWYGGRRLASIPVVYGSLSAMLFPWLSLFSVISLLTLDCKIMVEKRA